MVRLKAGCVKWFRYQNIFQFLMVRLKEEILKLAELDKKKFQFLMVRLKEKSRYIALLCEYEFQFLMVRLKVLKDINSTNIKK